MSQVSDRDVTTHDSIVEGQGGLATEANVNREIGSQLSYLRTDKLVAWSLPTTSILIYYNT